jgi:hypothetical protein
VGVLFVARPQFLFPDSDPNGNIFLLVPAGPELVAVQANGGIVAPAPITPAERSFAVICSVFGSFCAASAYATIRIIGKRAHSLVSVNYFSVLATVTSFLILVIHPDLHFEVPQTVPQWYVAFQYLRYHSLTHTGCCSFRSACPASCYNCSSPKASSAKRLAGHLS